MVAHLIICLLLSVSCFAEEGVIGVVATHPDHTAYVVPRYEGLVKEVYGKAGDLVQKGAKLAVIERNAASSYNLYSPMAGVILARNINPGEMVNQNQPSFEVSDLSLLRVNFELRRPESEKLKLGQKISIKEKDSKDTKEGPVVYIAPIADEATKRIRVSIDIAASRDWLPGKVVYASML